MAMEVLGANHEFYRCVSTADVHGISQLLAAHADVTCIHPGWPCLSGQVRLPYTPQLGRRYAGAVRV